METTYLHKFQKSVDQLDQKLFSENKLELKVGVWLNSTALKIQKQSWVNSSPTARPFEESIFFSVWINHQSIEEGRLYYNIHALKLRQLTGYVIKSREFAEAFRSAFKDFEKDWPNISLNFAPHTLMQGWVDIDGDNFDEVIVDLAGKFLKIYFIIDKLLEERKK